jgi:hypothetical protein
MNQQEPRRTRVVTNIAAFIELEHGRIGRVMMQDINVEWHVPDGGMRYFVPSKGWATEKEVKERALHIWGRTDKRPPAHADSPRIVLSVCYAGGGR